MSGASKKVLLVDDEPNILVALEYLMTDNGFVVEKATDGEMALAKAAVFHPEIVVLDVMMPGLNGFEVARLLRNNPQFSDLKIVFLTAKGTPADKMSGYAKGGDVYLVKPFDNDKLMRVVSELVEYG
ncbi:MAG: response regulator [Bacteroidota bacterium]